MQKFKERHLVDILIATEYFAGENCRLTLLPMDVLERPVHTSYGSVILIFGVLVASLYSGVVGVIS